jgi:hypothetical protein
MSDNYLEYRFVQVNTRLLPKALHPKALQKHSRFELVPRVIEQAQARNKLKFEELVLANQDANRRVVPTRRIW